MNGNFLLDSSTGRVWVFDAGKHVFNEAPKKLSRLNYWLIERHVEEMLEKAGIAVEDEALANIPEALRGEMRSRYTDQYIKPVREELLKLKPS